MIGREALCRFFTTLKFVELFGDFRIAGNVRRLTSEVRGLAFRPPVVFARRGLLILCAARTLRITTTLAVQMCFLALAFRQRRRLGTLFHPLPHANPSFTRTPL